MVKELNSKQKYVPPMYEGKPQYVHVVAKNKDDLCGCIRGHRSMSKVISQVMGMFGLAELNVGTNEADFMELSSSQFNNILDTGVRLADMSDSDIKEYTSNLYDTISDKIGAKLVDHDPTVDAVLTISCDCNFGHYSWKTFGELPEETFKCIECGRVLIHYTNENVSDYEYDNGKEAV